MKKKLISDWLQVFIFSLLIFITIPFTPLLWKLLSKDQKFILLSGIYILVFFIGILTLIYLFFYKKEKKLFSYFCLLIIALMYILALNKLSEFPVEKIHLIEYGVLGFLVFKALKNSIKDLTVYIWSVLVTFFIGITDEIIQWIVPNRVGTIEDVLLNTKSSIFILMLIGLVIKPEEIEKSIPLRSLKNLYIPICFALIATGIFINFIHGFGYIIKVNDYLEVYSHFSGSEINSIDNFLKKNVDLLESTAKKFESSENRSRDISNAGNKLSTFFKEAADHKWERDNSFSKKRFIKSLNEQSVLDKLYSSVFYFDFFKWNIDKNNIAKKLSFGEMQKDKYYKSPVCGILITKFSKLQMWIFIIIVCSIFIMLFIGSK